MENRPKDANGFRVNVALAGFVLVAAFFLVTEHKAHLQELYVAHEVHVLGALPYLLLLLCPLMHLFMHGGGHGGHGDDRQAGEGHQGHDGPGHDHQGHGGKK